LVLLDLAGLHQQLIIFIHHMNKRN
jgi:hypothetical protein